MRHEELLRDLTARAVGGEEEGGLARLRWRAGLWAVFDAGLISPAERNAWLGGLHLAKHPQPPRPSADERKQQLAVQAMVERSERQWEEARKAYAADPSRLPRLPSWLPDWVILPDKDDGENEPVLLLVEGRDSGVQLNVRVPGVGRKEARFPWFPRVPGQPHQQAGRAADDIGTEYEVFAGGQTGRLLNLGIRPAPPDRARVLNLKLEGGGSWSLDLSTRLAVDETLVSPERVGQPELCSVIDGARALRAAELRALRFRHEGRRPWEEMVTAYLEAALDALNELGLLDETSAQAARDRLGAAADLAEHGLFPVRRAIYFRQPATVGVRLLALFLSERTIAVRWAQLPHEYGPDLPARWTLSEGTMPEVQLADDSSRPYVQALQQTGSGGRWSTPFWHGYAVFLTTDTTGVGRLECQIGDTAAQLKLGNG